MILKIEVPDLGVHLKVMTNVKGLMLQDIKSQLPGKVTLINHLNDIIYLQFPKASYCSLLL